MNAETGGRLTAEEREVLAPFVRGGNHDGTCSIGCFAEHGTEDELHAAVERILADRDAALARAWQAGHDAACPLGEVCSAHQPLHPAPRETP